jgi:hypothetical protein
MGRRLIILCVSQGKRRRVEAPLEHPVPAISLRRPELPPAHVPHESKLLRTLRNEQPTSAGKANLENNVSPIDFSASHGRITRDAESLTVIETLEMGPYEHIPPPDDPKFDQVDPHSNIRLEYVYHNVRSSCN